MKNNKLILIGYRNPAIKTYTPKYNNVKRLSFVGACAVSLLIPFTTIPLTFAAGLITKFKPLYFYK